MKSVLTRNGTILRRHYDVTGNQPISYINTSTSAQGDSICLAAEKHIFFAAADQVLAMYDRRQANSKKIEPHTTSEIHWASEMLITLAGVAAYTANAESVVINEIANEWRRSGVRPVNFLSTTEGAAS